MEQERSELLADPEGPIRRDLEQLGIEVEAGEDESGGIGAARRRSHTGKDVDGQVGQRVTGLVADDLPRHTTVGIAEHRGGPQLRGRPPEARVDPVDGQLVVGRVLPRPPYPLSVKVHQVSSPASTIALKPCTGWLAR